MKKLELLFTAALLPLDYLTLLLSGTIAYFLRFESFFTEIRPVVFALTYGQFFRILTVVSLVWLAVFALNGLYTTKRENSTRLLSRIIVACSAATLLIVVAFFFNFQLFSSRLIILTGWILSIIFISLERGIIHFIKKIFYKKGLGVRYVAVIGADKNSQDIIEEFKSHPSYGFRIVNVFSLFNNETEERLLTLLSEHQLDDIILADPSLANEEKSRLVNFCIDHHVGYKYTASLLETKLINFELSTVGGVPLIEVKQTRLDGWGKIIKRIFDFLVSLIVFIILLPIFIIIGLIIVLTSKGPVLVRLERIGEKGTSFKLFKFRSMIKDADKLKDKLRDLNQRADGPLFKLNQDPRITPFGKFLRRWSLDELPQLINVILGQMSLVGPRPHEPKEVSAYELKHKKLLAIKPGITGMAQVSGRSDLLWDEEVRLDTYYIENWSPGLDIQIIFKTPKAVIAGRTAV